MKIPVVHQLSVLYPGMVIAPSASDLESSKSCVRSMSETVPRPSQRGHMPPVLVNVCLTVLPAPRSIVIAPLPWTEGTLKENAFEEPMCGCPSRLNRTRSIALASVAVPTVERALAPMRSWSTMIAVVRPSSTSTSGRDSVGMKPCTKVLYVSLISRCDSAAIVPNTSELLPEPETPVNTVSPRFGISTLTSLRLFSRAPCTRIRSWLPATLSAGECVSVRVAVLIVRCRLCRSWLRSPDGSAELVDADLAARGIAEGAVANPVRLFGRLLDDVSAAGLQPRENAVEVGGGQDDAGVAALGHQLDDRAGLVVGDARGGGRRSSSVPPGVAAGG